MVLRRESRLYSAERRAVAEAVYGVLRAQGRLGWLLGPRASIAELYAAFLAASGAIPAPAAEKRLGLARGALDPLASAGARIGAITDPVERLSVEGSIPYWLARQLTAELGADDTRAFAAAANLRAPLTVRANLLRTTREALRDLLAGEGVESTPTPLSPWGLVLDGHANVFGLDAFKAGLLEVQDEGSQLIALACGARPGMRVVDACAGAGGKTLALAAEMRNKGVLVALDSDEGRLDEARRRARRAGVDNLRTRPIPADAAADAALTDEEGKADVVLVDAPCSGLGTLRRKPDARWRLQPGDPERFAALQRELVVRFARLVKPGGRLVYATCSVARAEDEDVAAAIPALTGLVPAPLEPLLGSERARAAGAAGNALRLWPHVHGTDGFFLAAFTRPKG